ncbi:MAG: diacylglycerol kinase family protein [Chloroflexi bacterium]|nr:diacylglycerol kinase family protein [Chloroflexota bacterium]
MGKSLWEEIKSARQTDPNQYAYKVSESRWSSFIYALAGFGYMFRWQRNVRLLTLITPIVFMMGLWLSISLVEWAIIVVMICVVWLAEFLNAGIEAAIDLAANGQHHPMAKIGKDVAAAAVLLASIGSALVGLLIFLKPLLDKLGV